MPVSDTITSLVSSAIGDRRRVMMARPGRGADREVQRIEQQRAGLAVRRQQFATPV